MTVWFCTWYWITLPLQITSPCHFVDNIHCFKVYWMKIVCPWAHKLQNVWRGHVNQLISRLLALPTWGFWLTLRQQLVKQWENTLFRGLNIHYCAMCSLTDETRKTNAHGQYWELLWRSDDWQLQLCITILHSVLQKQECTLYSQIHFWKLILCFFASLTRKNISSCNYTDILADGMYIFSDGLYLFLVVSCLLVCYTWLVFKAVSAIQSYCTKHCTDFQFFQGSGTLE